MVDPFDDVSSPVAASGGFDAVSKPVEQKPAEQEDSSRLDNALALTKAVLGLPPAVAAAVAEKLTGAAGGAVGTLAAGGAGIGKLVLGAASGIAEHTGHMDAADEFAKIGQKINPQATMEKVQEGMTYHPEDPEAQMASQVMDIPAEAWNKVSELAGEKTAGVAGPLAGTAVELGMKFAPQVALGPLMKGVKVKPVIDDVADFVGGSELREALDPIGSAGPRAAAMASDYASTNRAAQYARNETIKEFNQEHGKQADEVAEDLHRALGEENVKRRTGKGKFVEEPIPEDELPSTPLGGKKFSGIPLHELSIAQLRAAAEKVKGQEIADLTEIFGNEADAKLFQRSAASESDAGYKRGQKLFEALPPAKQKLIEDWEQGRGKYRTELTHSEVDNLNRQVDYPDDSSPQALADSLRWAATKIGQKTNPALMDAEELGAYLMFKESLKIAAEKGWDTKDISRKIINAAADRFSDPQDAEFMLRRFLKKDAIEGEAAPVEKEVTPTTRLREVPSGFDRLPADRRATLEKLSVEHEAVAERAVELGILADKFEVYDPRIVGQILDDGTVKALTGKGAKVLNKAGGNLVKSLKQAQFERKYLTPEETEAAAQRMGEQMGLNLSLVRDVRTLPMVTASLKKAIAGRELLESIKAEGERTGSPTVSTKPEGEGWFTVQGSPMFTVRRPMIRNGEAVKDPNGRVIFNTQQLYMAPEYEGPVKAIMDSTDPHIIYRGLMQIKSIGTQAIMFNPLVHNVTILSKAFPAVGPRVFGWWWKGMDLFKDKAKVEQMIKDGVVPVNQARFQSEMSGGLPQPKFHKNFLDKADDLWHGKLLWDRIAGVQAGIYQFVKEDLVKKGLPEKAAGAAGARLANLYGGAIPKEELSTLAHQVGNIALFSKSFTGTNLALYKDAFSGFPASTKGKILRAYEAMGKSAEEAEKALKGTSNKFARRQAIGAIIKDVALAYGGLMITHYAIQRMTQSPDKMAQDYGKRLQWSMKQEEKDPFYVLKNPLDTAQYLGAPVEEGKEGRVFIGNDSVTGRPLYGKPGFGKVADDLIQAWKDPQDLLDRKLSPTAKWTKEVIQNKDFYGAKLWLADHGVAENAKRLVEEFVKLNIPADALNSVNETLEDKRLTDAQKVRLAGTIIGAFSVSQGVGQEKAMVMKHQQQKADEMKLESKDINHLIDTNPSAAVAKMSALGMKPDQIIQRIRNRRMMATPSARTMVNAQRDMTNEQLDLLERPTNE